MSVTVSLIGPLRELAGGVSTVELDASTVAQVLDELGTRFGREFAARARKARILVNGTGVQFMEGRATRLSDGDEVALLFPVGGG